MGIGETIQSTAAEAKTTNECAFIYLFCADIMALIRQEILSGFIFHIIWLIISKCRVINPRSILDNVIMKFHHL